MQLTAHNMEDSRRPVHPGTLQKSPLPPLRKGEKVSGASLIQSVQGPSGRVGECFGGADRGLCLDVQECLVSLGRHADMP